MLLEARVLPHVLAVPQRPVESASLVNRLAPRNRVILILALAFFHVDRAVVDAEDDVQPIAAVGRVLELVDLVGDFVALHEALACRVVRGLDVQPHFLVPRRAGTSTVVSCPSTLRFTVTLALGSLVKR